METDIMEISTPQNMVQKMIANQKSLRVRQTHTKTKHLRLLLGYITYFKTCYDSRVAGYLRSPTTLSLLFSQTCVPSKPPRFGSQCMCMCQFLATHNCPNHHLNRKKIRRPNQETNQGGLIKTGILCWKNAEQQSLNSCPEKQFLGELQKTHPRREELLYLEMIVWTKKAIVPFSSTS